MYEPSWFWYELMINAWKELDKPKDWRMWVDLPINYYDREVTLWFPYHRFVMIEHNARGIEPFNEIV